MPVNLHRVGKWKSDVARSVDFYNSWFMKFAPKAYRETRSKTTREVELALRMTANLRDIKPSVLRSNPSVLPMLRMTTAPPIARDRLVGLANISPNLVASMEKNMRIPPRMSSRAVDVELEKIADIIMKLADRDLFTWLDGHKSPSTEDLSRAASIVADRLCGAQADPIIRNAQEQRQLVSIRKWLEDRGYTFIPAGIGTRFDEMQPATFAFHVNVPVTLKSAGSHVNVPVDVVVQRRKSKAGELPLLIEAKSAGDFTNTNKRRKEEATKMSQLQSTYRGRLCYILFLCGYFDSSYLGYEAAEGIDWVWEHRIDDLSHFKV